MCINGAFVAIELKKCASEEEAALQRWNLDEIGKAGGVGLLVTPENWETSYAFLHAIACVGLEKAKQQFH